MLAAEEPPLPSRAPAGSMLDLLEAVLPSPLGIAARRHISAKLPGLRP